MQNALKEFERALKAHDKVLRLRNHYTGKSSMILNEDQLVDMNNNFNNIIKLLHVNTRLNSLFYYTNSTKVVHVQQLRVAAKSADVLFQIIMCKRQARTALVFEQAIRDYRRTLRRERNRLEHLPIRHKRISELEDQIEHITETFFRPVRAFLAWNGGLLRDLFDQADKMEISLQDKAGIIGVSHKHLQNLVDEECDATSAANAANAVSPSLCEMVVVHHAEHRYIRESESFMPTGPETPLFSALMANVLELMRNNAEVRETISGGINRVLEEEAEKSRLRIVRKQ